MLLIFLLIIMLGFSSFGEASKTYGRILYDLGVISGSGINPDRTPILNEGSYLTREELIAILFKLSTDEIVDSYIGHEVPFIDVPNNWARPYIAFAYENKITSGTGGSQFGYGQKVTYQQAAQFIANLLKETQLYGSTFKWETILTDMKSKYMVYLDGVDAKAYLTRGQLFELISKALLMDDINGNPLVDRTKKFKTNTFEFRKDMSSKFSSSVNRILNGLEVDSDGLILLDSEIQDIIDAARRPAEYKQNAAYITINSVTNPIYWVYDRTTGNQQWFYTILFSEQNGIGVNIDEIRETHYAKNYGGGFMRYNSRTISNWFGDSYLEPFEMLSLTGGSTRCETAYVVWSIRGTDDNGNPVYFENAVAMSQEPLYHNSDSAYAFVYDAIDDHLLNQKEQIVDLGLYKEEIPLIGGMWRFTNSITSKSNGPIEILALTSFPITYHGTGNIKIYDTELRL